MALSNTAVLTWLIVLTVILIIHIIMDMIKYKHIDRCCAVPAPKKAKKKK